MAANDAIRTPGTPKTLEANGASISNDGIGVADDANMTSTDINGYPLAIFEFTTQTTGFSVAPTAGAAIHLYERKFMTGGTNQAPVVDSTYKNDYIGTFIVDVADAQQWLRIEGVPINYLGGTYYLEWVDGGAGTASLDAGWSLVCTPYTYAPAAA